MFSLASGVLKEDGEPVDQIASSFVGGNFPAIPKIAVIHFTAGASARSSADWFRNPANPGSSAHVVVDRDGSVIQCVSFKKVAWHAGRSRWKGLTGLNRHSFGIELANWGNLLSSSGVWTSSTGKRIAQPFLGNHRNGNPGGQRGPIGWEPYSDEQLRTAARIVRALIAAYGVNEIVGHDDISPTRKWDPGPAFDMAKFRTACLGGRADDGDNIVRVASGDGLNLRRGPGSHYDAIETLPDGAHLRPIGTEGRWIEVAALNADGSARVSGWVHGAFVVD